MALRQRGKQGYWHAYFRSERQTEKGIQRIVVTVPLGTTDKLEARALESELMRRNRQTIQRARVQRILNGSDNPDMPQLIPYHAHRKRRLLVSAALEAAARYRDIGESQKKIWRKFARETKIKYMDELTKEKAFDYLAEHCPGESGKRFNNVRSALNSVYKLTLMESGLEESPFERIPQRRIRSRHQRPFSEEEFVRIYEAAPQPWKTASLIAWHTGLRQKDVFTLRWSFIKEDVLETIPAKTARFGRGVRVPIHPQLLAELNGLPRANDRVLGAWEYKPNDLKFRSAFGELLDRLGIRDDDRGIVNFNSFRNSFVTRCDAAGVPRHAIRGIVGHVSDQMTDLYSHDLESARQIQKLPAAKLETPKQIQRKCSKKYVGGESEQK